MRRIRFCSPFLIFLFSQTAFAGPLHPLCLNAFTDNAVDDNVITSLELRACQKQYSHLSFDQKGPWVASYTTTDEQSFQENPERPTYAAYSIIGQMKNEQVLVNYDVSYGGSGTFTFVFLLKGLDLDSFPEADEALAGKQRSANLELVQRFNGGDRCFRGITDVRIEAPDLISLKRNMTSFGLVTLGLDKHQQQKSYGDLPDCAVCCVGSYTERIDLNGHTELQELTLNGSLLNNGKRFSKQQTCLAELAEAGQHRLALSPNDLKALQARYAEHCGNSANAKPN